MSAETPEKFVPTPPQLPDEDIPTHQMPAMTGDVLAAAEAEAATQKATAEAAESAATTADAPVEAADAPAPATPGDEAETNIKPLAPAAAPVAQAADEATDTVKPVAETPAEEPAATDDAKTKPSKTKTRGKGKAAAGDKPPTGTEPASPKAAAPKKRRNPLLVALVVVLVVLLSGVAALFVASRYYAGKAKIGTDIAGVSVAGQTEAQLRDTAQRLGGHLNIVISLDGKQYGFELGALGVTVNPQQTADLALARDKSNTHDWWPFRNLDVPLALDYSADELQGVLNNVFVAGSLKPQDAEVTLNEGTGQFEVVPDKSGTMVDIGPVEDAISTLARGGTVGTVEVTTKIVPAGILTAAATDAAATANGIIARSYTFNSEKKSYTLEVIQVADWITFTPDAASGTIKVGVDEIQVADQLPTILNAEIATPPVPHRVLFTPEGKQIAVESWGRNGTVLSDPTAAVTALTQAIESEQALNFDVKTDTQAYTTENVTVGGAYDQPNGSKWIDVNQSTFKVTLYEGTTVIRVVPCVTGGPATPTRNGTFYIYAKYDYQTMSGSNTDGTTWTLPNVPWVNYFDHGIALHGAYWRSSFGYRGSHGCVNLPVSESKIIYDWAPLGTRVVVHS